MPVKSNVKIGTTLSLFDESEISFTPSDEFRTNAYFSSYNQYKKIYNFSIEDREKFWSNTAKELHWFNPWKKVKKGLMDFDLFKKRF